MYQVAWAVCQVAWAVCQVAWALGANSKMAVVLAGSPQPPFIEDVFLHSVERNA